MSGNRILLVEDQVLFRKALKHLLGQDRAEYHVAEVSTAREALQDIKKKTCDLLITDLCLPEEDGLWLLCKIREAGIELPILVVTASERPELISRAIELGARGSLRKTSEPQQLLRAVDKLLRGESYFAESFERAGDSAPKLSARTLELLCLANNGVESEEIQQRMGLSSESFASLAKGVCRKLAAESLESATRKAYTLGLIAGRDHG